MLPASGRSEVAKSVVYIYKDQGVSEESYEHTLATFEKYLRTLYAIQAIDAQSIREGSWKNNAALLIVPGGADLPYVQKLKGPGNEQIQDYVRQGGSFLGICAGSYYASAYVEFDKNGPLEVLGERELQFFEGKAVGPILAPYDYRTNSGSRAAQLFTVFKEVPQTEVYYNGGGFFESPERFSNTRVLATYDNGLAAMVSIHYGKGRVVLSGVHFEYDPGALNEGDVYIQKILTDLKNNDASRVALMKKLLENLSLF